MNSRARRKGQAGFTLLEMLVAVLLFAGLAAFLVPKVGDAVETQKVVSCIDVLGNVASQYESTYSRTDTFPTAGALFPSNAPNCSLSASADGTGAVVLQFTRPTGTNSGLGAVKYSRKSDGAWCWSSANATAWQKYGLRPNC